MGKPLEERVLLYFLFFSLFNKKSFFSSLFNSWFLTNWSHLPGLRSALLEMEEAQIWTMGKLPAFVGADPIGWIARV